MGSGQSRKTAISLNALESVQEHLGVYEQKDLNKELIQLNKDEEKAELPILFCLLESISLHHENIVRYMKGDRERLLEGTICKTVDKCNSWYREFQILMLELLESAANTKLNVTSLKRFRQSVKKYDFFSLKKLVKNYCDYNTALTPTDSGPDSAPLNEFLDRAVTGEVFNLVSLSRGNDLAMEVIALVLLEHYVIYPVSRHIPDEASLVSKIKSHPIFSAAINENGKVMQFKMSSEPDIPRNKILLGTVGSSVVYSENLLYDVQFAPEGEDFLFANPWPGKAKAKGKYKLELANHTVIFPEVYVVPDLIMNSLSVNDLKKTYFISMGQPYTILISRETSALSVIAIEDEEDPRPFIVSPEESRRLTISPEAQGDIDLIRSFHRTIGSMSR